MSDQPSKPRPIVVVDTETNGLDPDRHEAVEVAWWNLSTDERGVFIPCHDESQVLANADVKALQINRYIDRIADHVLPVGLSGAACADLANQMRGATLAGSNPSFDAVMLHKLLRPRSAGVLQTIAIHPRPRPWSPPWHHRMLDLSAYAAGLLGLDDLPGLAKVCGLLDVAPPDHTAEADVTATGLCFRALFKLQDERRRIFGVPPDFVPQRVS